MRGKASTKHSKSFLFGITPAYAGKSNALKECLDDL